MPKHISTRYGLVDTEPIIDLYQELLEESYPIELSNMLKEIQLALDDPDHKVLLSGKHYDLLIKLSQAFAKAAEPTRP